MSLARVIALACVNAALLAAADSDVDVAIRGVLTRYMRFTTGELGDLQAGKVVRHGLDSTAAGEVGVAGAVRINSPKTKFLARVPSAPLTSSMACCGARLRLMRWFLACPTT